MNGANSIDLDVVLGAPEDHLAGQISRIWEQWRGASNEARRRWEETTRYVYATSTNETTNASNDHNHSTHIPVITQIKDNLEANYIEALFPNDDWFIFKGFDQNSVDVTKRQTIESYLKTKHDYNKFTNVVQQLVGDWTLYGNCFAGVTYEQQLHQSGQQGLTGFTGPRLYRISPYDIVFNPLATSFAESPKIIRTVKSIAELQRDVEEKPELAYEEDIVSRVINSREALKKHTDTEIDKSFQLQFEGFGNASMYYQSGQVELLEFYGDIWDEEEQKLYKNHVITVVDRRWIVRNQPLNTWTGRPHIYHCGWRTRPDNIWGMGPLDNLVGMQYKIDHLENARADAFDLMLSPDRVFRGDVEDIRQVNGANYYFVGENGNVNNLLPDTTVLNADFQISTLMQQMELTAGAPREAAGFRTPGEKTAFEVQSLMNGASRLFQHKINYFSREFLEPILEAEIEVARRNLDTIDVVEIVDSQVGLSEFLTVTKEDITANGKLRAMGSRYYARNNQLVQNLAQFSQQLAQDPLMQQHFPSERLGRAYEHLLGFGPLELMTPYGRVAEQLELQQLSQVAQQQVMEEDATSVDEGMIENELDISETIG